MDYLHWMPASYLILFPNNSLFSFLHFLYETENVETSLQLIAPSSMFHVACYCLYINCKPHCLNACLPHFPKYWNRLMHVRHVSLFHSNHVSLQSPHPVLIPVPKEKRLKFPSFGLIKSVNCAYLLASIYFLMVLYGLGTFPFSACDSMLLRWSLLLGLHVQSRISCQCLVFVLGENCSLPTQITQVDLITSR